MIKKKKMWVVLLVAGVLAGLVNAGIVDSAALYLPFEGEDTGIASDCWKNKGTVGYDESPTELVAGTYGPPTTIEAGIKGWAMNNATTVPRTSSAFYQYGLAGTGGANDTALEQGLMGAWSYTIAGWVKVATTNSQGRWFFSPYLEANAAVSSTWASIVNAASTASDNLYATNNPTFGTWAFLAVTYDGTSSTDNFKIYFGDESLSVTLSAEMTTSVITGQLTDVRGVADGHRVVVGNGTGTRPLFAYIDEVRMWVSQTEDSGGALSLEQLEQVRQFDLIPEPASLSLLTLGAVSLVLKRKK